MENDKGQAEGDLRSMWGKLHEVSHPFERALEAMGILELDCADISYRMDALKRHQAKQHHH